ncbi:hypothetical protein HPB50_018634 [Hyalomma asiaticum]|uniref:Uncharacterized protein n=1 Tax=Hyalomma asiaticum TaxID=266040 RepID=A0ACB7SRW5_HYAAI|nr:hypothetical protein HPB50_018634 [Hyalomma asiaticum]
MDAMVKLHCHRVGHGYRVFQDPTGKTFRMAQEKNLHFESCPYSSVLTGGCTLSSQKHSVVRFAEENANFSISKDDTTITGSTLDDEYDFLRQLGLTEAHFIRANLNAARSCFLSEMEKKDLIQSLKEEYGISPMKEENKKRFPPVQPVQPVRPLPPIRPMPPMNPGGARFPHSTPTRPVSSKAGRKPFSPLLQHKKQGRGACPAGAGWTMPLPRPPGIQGNKASVFARTNLSNLN